MTDKIPTLDYVTAAVCRASLFEFFCEFWDEIIADKLYLNWHIKYICDEIQEILEGVIAGTKTNDDLMINIFPGSTKSTIISIMAPAWLWTRMPHCVTLCNTRKEVNAIEFSVKFRKIITSEKYRKFFPEIVIRNDSSALKRIQNTLGGARRQYTTMSIPTGDHGHIRFDDDQEIYEDAISVLQHETSINSNKAYSTREKKNAYVPYIIGMQRLAATDICTYILEVKPNIKHIVLPAFDNGKIQPPELKKFYVNGLMNPEHISESFLKNKKKGLGDLRYLAEYGQDCDTKLGYLYDIKKIFEIEDKGLSIACIDPADDGDCYLACVFAKIYNNKIYINDIIYTKDNSSITIPLIATKCMQHKPYAVHIEKDGIGAMFGKQVKDKYPLVKPFNAVGNKDQRIFGTAEIISENVVFLENSNSLDYENAVNAMVTYKRVGENKYKDIQDCITSLVDQVIKNNLINIYA